MKNTNWDVPLWKTSSLLYLYFDAYTIIIFFLPYNWCIFYLELLIVSTLVLCILIIFKWFSFSDSLESYNYIVSHEFESTLVCAPFWTFKLCVDSLLIIPLVIGIYIGTACVVLNRSDNDRSKSMNKYEITYICIHTHVCLSLTFPNAVKRVKDSKICV